MPTNLSKESVNSALKENDRSGDDNHTSVDSKGDDAKNAWNWTHKNCLKIVTKKVH